MRLATALGAVVVLGTGVFASVPAQAALSDCATDTTCLWSDNDFSGDRTARAHGRPTIINVPAILNNEMDSWANRSGTFGSCGYDGLNGGGDKQEWDATTRDNNVSPFNSDEVSSWRTRLGC